MVKPLYPVKLKWQQLTVGGRHELSKVHSHTRAFSRAVGLMKQGYAITVICGESRLG
jgi:hypothetical protein